MKLSAPIHRLKRNAKLLSRSAEIPLFQALNRIAREEGFDNWSELSHRYSMQPVEGTSGYEKVVARFIQATESVDFNELHQPYLELFPSRSEDILDIGSGVGRDASVLAGMGHRVVAVEPMAEFLEVAKNLHDAPNITWIRDSLPCLNRLDEYENLKFGFVLASAVWHHISDEERTFAMSRISELSKIQGIFALSLRNGPAGGGSRVFPTDHKGTICLAEKFGFKLIKELSNQKSLLPGKDKVRWSKLVFRRIE